MTTLFSDQNDINFFIEQHQLTPSNSFSGSLLTLTQVYLIYLLFEGMIIQAYLIFCHMAEENMAAPIAELISSDNTTVPAENNIFSQDLGNIQFIKCISINFR